MERRKALTIADQFIELIGAHVSQVSVAGSVRREKPEVKDIEIVAIPYRGLLEYLDDLLRRHKIAKAPYIDKNGETTYRWGKKYRGIRLAGSDAKIELFLTTPEAWGYQFWLRTGPGDANRLVMECLIALRAPFVCAGGMVSDGDGRQIAVPDEQTFFDLLGIRYIEPKDRTLAWYRRALTPAGGWKGWGMNWQIVEPVEEPGQLRLL